MILPKQRLIAPIDAGGLYSKGFLLCHAEISSGTIRLTARHSRDFATPVALKLVTDSLPGVPLQPGLPHRVTSCTNAGPEPEGLFNTGGLLP